MKYILSIACSILLLGCSNSSTENTVTEATTPQTPISTTISEPNATTAVETNTNNENTPEQPVTSAAVDGGSLFTQKCAACHGSKAEKSALNKSQIIANFNEQQIKDALHGYQAGTYGKEMKALMQGQAKGLNDEQIDALAKYIPSI
ncbi:MAG: c-type cytochrome [Sulfuricurvum sp.]|nr:c-type cytochrome [Sulfuricurvum sp.]